MIEIKNIHKTFGDNRVLRGISATFKPGLNSLIIGGSGSGKTTLAKELSENGKYPGFSSWDHTCLGN